MLKLALFFIILSACSAAFAGVADRPAKLSLLPGIALPDTESVRGLDLGIFGTRTDKVDGIQSALFYARLDEKSRGVQYSCVTLAEDFTGFKLAFVNTGRNVRGMMMGVVNSSGEMRGFQLGVVNVSTTMYGVQLGLVNVIRTGNLPFMVLLNADW